MIECDWPPCKEEATHNEYCVQHNRIYGKPKEKKKPTPIAKVSPSMKDKLKEYNKLKKPFLAANHLCELKMEGCTKIAEVVHHSRGREGDQLTNVDDWMASCPKCNITCEENHHLAKSLGIKKPKHQKRE